MSGPIVYKGKTYPHLNALSDAEAVVANSTVDGRLRAGWPIEKALKTPAKKIAPAKPITKYKGRTYPTFKALAEAESAVPHKTVESRLRLGWPLEKALKTPLRNDIEYKGKTYSSIKALVEAEGVVSYKAVSGRLDSGWPLEKALKTPGREITYKGTTYPMLKDLVEAEGVVSLGSFHTRRTLGWSLEEALKTPLKDTSVTYQKKTYPSLEALAEAEGVVSVGTVVSRLGSGWPIEKALKTPAQEQALDRAVPVYKGKSYPTWNDLVEAESDIPFATVDSRLRLGWPLEKALKKPVEKQRPKIPIRTKYKGKTYNTLAELVSEEGVVPYSVVNTRLRLGWKLHDALKTPKENRINRVFNVDGKTYENLSMLAKAYKLPYTTVMSRARSKYSDREIVYGRPRKKRKNTGDVARHPIVIAGKSYPSKTAAARHFGIQTSTFNYRLSAGFSPEQAAGLVQKTQRAGEKRGPKGTVIVKGQVFPSMSKAASHFGVSESRTHYRMRKGATPEQALGLERYSTAFSIEFRGKMYESQKALAEAHGLDGDLVGKRMRILGWTLEEALEVVDRPISALSKGQYNQKFFERNPAEKGQPAVLYFVNITHAASGQLFSKIGITARTVGGRLAKASGYSYEEITSKETTLYDAWLLEQMILEDYADSGIVWQEIDFGGRTECFNFSDEQIDEIRQLIDEL